MLCRQLSFSFSWLPSFICFFTQLSTLTLSIPPLTVLETKDWMLQIFSKTMTAVRSILSETQVNNHEEVFILGSPIQHQSIDESITDNCNVSRIPKRSKDDQPSPYPLSSPQRPCHYLASCLPFETYRATDSIMHFDEITRNVTETVCNAVFDDRSWRQATVPVSHVF